MSISAPLGILFHPHYRTFRLALSAGFLSAAFASFPTGSALSQSPSIKTNADTPVVILRSGVSSNTRTSARLVIRDSATWAKVWAEANNARPSIRPLPPLPAVAFDHEMVLAAFMGAQGLTGSGIAIASVTDSSGILHIRVRLGALGENCVGGSAMQSPLVIVRVRVSYSMPVFEDRAFVTSCKDPFRPATP